MKCSNMIRMNNHINIKEFLNNNEVDFKRVMTNYYIVSDRASTHHLHVLYNIAAYLSTFKLPQSKLEPFNYTLVKLVTHSLFDDCDVNRKYMEMLVLKLNALLYPDSLSDEHKMIYSSYISKRDIRYSKIADSRKGRLSFIAYVLSGHTNWYANLDTKFKDDISSGLNRISDDRDILLEFKTDNLPIIPIVANMATRHRLTVYYSYVNTDFEFAGELLIVDGITKVKRCYNTSDVEFSQIYCSIRNDETISKYYDGHTYYHSIASKNQYSNLPYGSYLALDKSQIGTNAEREYISSLE